MKYEADRWSVDMSGYMRRDICDWDKLKSSDNKNGSGELNRIGDINGTLTWSKGDVIWSVYIPSSRFSFFYFILENRKRVTKHPFPFS